MTSNRLFPSRFDPPQTKSYHSSEDHNTNVVMIFRQLYLGQQLRYKPSTASILSPASVAID
jgi:hypothetical protein